MLAGNIFSAQEPMGVHTHFLLWWREHLRKRPWSSNLPPAKHPAPAGWASQGLSSTHTIGMGSSCDGGKIKMSGKVAARSEPLSRPDWFPSYSQKGLGKHPNRPDRLLEPTGISVVAKAGEDSQPFFFFSSLLPSSLWQIGHSTNHSFWWTRNTLISSWHYKKHKTLHTYAFTLNLCHHEHLQFLTSIKKYFLRNVMT